jgi:hypothetical protein
MKETKEEKFDDISISISEQYRDKITELVIYPLLGKKINNSELYFNLLSLLSIYIREELEINGTTKKERMQHIQLFRNTREKWRFLGIKIFRDPESHWDVIYKKLENSEILDKKTSKKYLDYMFELTGEYNKQKEHYDNEKDIKKKNHRLMTDRLYNSLISQNKECKFGFNYNENVIVHPIEDENQFFIKMDSINYEKAEKINWILTSNHVIYKEEVNLNKFKDVYVWWSQSIEDTVEKVYRILHEFYENDQNYELQDNNL